MNKKLTFLAAFMAVASMTQAAVLFEEDWSWYASTPEELDASRWQVDDGCFGAGLNIPCKGDYQFAVDGTYLNIMGTHGTDGYWSGYSLITVPTFNIGEGEALVIEAKRAWNHNLGTQSDKATRSGIQMIAPDKSKWLLIADNNGESNWGYNPYTGLASDYPVNNPSNVGYTFDTINTVFADVLHDELDVRIIATQTDASVYFRNPYAEEPTWVFGKTIPNNFTENIAIGLSAYARTPETATAAGDTVEAAFGPLTVSSAGVISFDKSDLSIADEKEVTISVSPKYTPLTVTINNADPTIVSADSTVTFAKGESSKTLKIKALRVGKTKLTITPGSSDVVASGELNISVSEPAGIKLQDSFDGTEIDANTWDISNRGYEWRSYPDATVSMDFFGVRDGSLVADNMVAQGNYWGGKSLVTKKTLLGTTDSSLKITVDFGAFTCTSGESAAEGLILRNADSSCFFALRNCRGNENGWVYNTAIGAGGAVPGAWAGIDTASSSVARQLVLVYDGKTISLTLDGIYGGSFNWVCNDPMYVELGFYAREAGASGNGSFGGITIENVKESVSYEIAAEPSSVKTFNGFKNLVAITIPEQSVVENDVTLTFTSQDPTVAYPETETMTFTQGGELTQYLNIVSMAAEKASTVIDVTSDSEVLLPVTINVTAYSVQQLFADDFSGGYEKNWTRKSPSLGGTDTDVTYSVKDGMVYGGLTCVTQKYPTEVIRLNDEFYPTADQPVIFEYVQGPIGGLGTIVASVGQVIDLNNGTTAGGLARERGDVNGWQKILLPDSDYGTQGMLATPLLTNELLDNSVNHKVRLVKTGGALYVYVDDYYGGSMTFDTGKVAFAVGGTVYTKANYVTYSHGDVKVYGTPVITVDDTELNLSEGEDTLEFRIPQMILDAGVAITLTIEDPTIATFDTGATKVLNLNSASSRDQIVTVQRKSVGMTSLTIANDKEFAMSADTVSIKSQNLGEILFQDEFEEYEIDTNKWAVDYSGYEPTSPGEGAGSTEAYGGWGLTCIYSATQQYWGGLSYFSLPTFKCSKVDPLTYEITMNNFGGSGTGFRAGAYIRTADRSKWLFVNECHEGTSFNAWGINHHSLKATGTPSAIAAWSGISAVNNDVVVTVQLDGQNATVYLNGIEGGSFEFAATENIQFGLATYGRAIDDNSSASFFNAKVSGSNEPRPDMPEITAQSADTVAPLGTPFKLSVTATGADITYTWYKDGIALDYASSPSYAVSAATEADYGVYTVEVSNITGGVVSAPISVTPPFGKVMFEDNFEGSELTGDWTIDNRPFEYASYPNATGTTTCTVDNGLFLDFTLTANYWGGVTYYLPGVYEVSKEAPLTFVVGRAEMGFSEGATGARSSIVISNTDGSNWINLAESLDDGTFRGWSWNKYTGAADDKMAGGGNIVNEFAQYSDMGDHTITVTLNGETAVFAIDGNAALTLDFNYVRVRLGVGAFARMVPDRTWSAFSKVQVYGEETPAPVVDPTLSYEIVDGNLVLTFEGALESSEDGINWVAVDATSPYTVALTGAKMFFRASAAVGL